MTIGVLHPGEMGAAVGAALRAADQTVVWASTGRGAATAKRAEAAGLEDVGTLEELGRRSDVIVALCPPHAALEVARAFSRFPGVYVDANAVSPATAREIAGLVGRCVDGGIVGPPPRRSGTTRLYLSALLLAVRAVARAEGVEETSRGVAAVIAALARPVDRSRSLRARQGLALGRRNGGDRGSIHRGRPAGRLPSSGSRDLRAIAPRRAPRRGRGPRARTGSVGRKA